VIASSTKIPPPYSLILVGDPGEGNIPASIDGSLIASTDSCVAVGCRSETDGDTQFVLGDTRDVDPGGQPIFQGTLKTPGHRIALRSVIGLMILETPVPHDETTIRVWVNDPNEPDQVIVGIG
jgi:hypothetical protein